MSAQVGDGPVGSHARALGSELSAEHRASVGVLVVVAGLFLMAGAVQRVDQHHDVDIVFGAMAVVVLLVTAGRSWLRWRLERAAPAVWGAAVLLLASATIALADLQWLGLGVGWSQVIAAGTFVAMGALMVQAWGLPPHDGDERPRRLLVVGATSLLLVVPIAMLLDLEIPRNVPIAPRELPHGIVLGMAWVVLGVCATIQGWRRGRTTFVWIGLLGVAMTLHEVVMGFAAAQDSLPAPGHAGLVLIGALMAAHGVDLDLQLAFIRQREALDRSRDQAASALALVDEARAQTRARVHEARNALAAVSGAVQLLERYRDDLPLRTRSELARSLAREIEHLQRLMSEDPAPSTHTARGQE